MNRKSRRIFSLVFTAACVIGMIYQEVTIVNLFLQHKVSTTTSVYTPQILEYLALTACFPQTIINLTLLNREMSSNWTKDTLEDDSLITTTSVKTLLKYTPSAESIISYYGYVHPKRKNDRIPTTNLSFEKFVYDYHVCYKIRLNSYHSVLLEDAAGKGALSRITFTSKLKSIRGFRITFGSPDKFPVREIITSRYVERGGNATKQDLPNAFQSNHYQIQRQSLPYPYESNCFDYQTHGMKDDFECLNACFVKKSLQKFHRFPKSAVILKDFNYTFVAPFYRTNSTFYERMSRLKDDCRMQCAKKPCQDTQVVTLVDNGMYSESFAKNNMMSILIRHMIPIFPFVNITSRASQSIEELLTLALSSVSTWTGLSIIALNPVKLLTRLFSTRHKVEPSQQTSRLHHDCLFARTKQQKKLLVLLALRDKQMKEIRRDLNRIEWLVNSLVNSTVP